MASKIKYNFELLQEFCEQNNINLSDEYTDKNTNCNIKIKNKCANINCNNIYEKKFHILFKTNNFMCKLCSKINGFIKNKETINKKYGVDYIWQSKEIRNKITKTFIEKYGCNVASKSEIVKKKIKDTNFIKYNFTPKITLTKEEQNSKLIEKYGSINFRSSKIIKDKIINTCIQKYNVTHISKVPQIQKMKKENCLNKYGCEFPIQDPTIAEKCFKNMFKSKPFVFPSGNSILVQGYEPFALHDILYIENVNEEDIITGCKYVPEIWYNDNNGKKHRHYVDIFIKSQNRCIEVKSLWTIKKENVFIKQKAAINMGFIYEIWVYNNKGTIIQKY